MGLVRILQGLALLVQRQAPLAPTSQCGAWKHEGSDCEAGLAFSDDFSAAQVRFLLSEMPAIAGLEHVLVE